MFGVPLGELAVLAAAIVAGGVVTGILAGLFGIGGGAIIVPVLYEVFRILGVPEEVRMQLCVGTSLAIIVPTTIRSFLAHRAKGNLPVEVVRIWALPIVIGVVAGAVIAAFAPSCVFKLVFVVVTALIALRMLFGSETLAARRRVARPAGDVGYRLSHRASVGADGRQRRLDLEAGPDALRQADPQRGRDLRRPRRDRSRSPARSATCSAGWPQQALLPPLSIGFVSLIGFVLMAPVSSFTAPLRRAARAPPVEAAARNRLRPVSAAGRGALCRQPGLSASARDSRASSACRRAPPSFPAG